MILCQEKKYQFDTFLKGNQDSFKRYFFDTFLTCYFSRSCAII
nr:MAG TPA: hypothetical protein [Caudoviricetes sp.]